MQNVVYKNDYKSLTKTTKITEIVLEFTKNEIIKKVYLLFNLILKIGARNVTCIV